MSGEDNESRMDHSKSFLRAFVRSAFIDKYEATISLASSLAWPLLIAFLMSLFYTQISLLLAELARNISESSKIIIAGVSIEFFERRINREDEKAYAIIGILTQEELKMVMALGDTENYIESNTKEFSQIEPVLTSLSESGLVSLEKGTIPPSGVSGDVRFSLTPLGIRVYNELENVLVNIIEELPQGSSPD